MDSESPSHEAGPWKRAAVLVALLLTLAGFVALAAGASVLLGMITFEEAISALYWRPFVIIYLVSAICLFAWHLLAGLWYLITTPRHLWTLSQQGVVSMLVTGAVALFGLFLFRDWLF